MLREIQVRDFALIENLHLVWDSGLNILTGETGAGKSIIIDALGLVLGGRFSAEMIRTGAEACYIEAIFEPDEHNHQLMGVLSQLGIAYDPAESLIMAREVGRAGKSRCRINGQTVNVSTLAEVGALLVDIHGQHDHQSLISPDKQVDILDHFGGEALLTLRATVSRQYHQLAALKTEYHTLRTDEQEKARKLELLSFQLSEIEEANLQPDEEDELQKEVGVLAGAEKLFEACAQSYFLIYEGDDHAVPATAQLEEAINRLDQMTAVDQRLQPVVEMLRESAAQAEEAAREIKTYQDHIDFNPQRLEEVQTRLNEIHKLKRKYGSTIPEILVFAEKVRTEINSYAANDERRAEIEAEIQQISTELATAAGALSAKRRQTATMLEDAIGKELADLHMQKTRFIISFEQRKAEDGLLWNGSKLAVGPQGFDAIEFLVSPNPGEEPKPLSKIASGGELSRIMLALKAILGQVDEIATMIFDEIDAGVGGRAAQAVGEKMLLISQFRQVICITHLPQIASMAHCHFYIEKTVRDERTIVSISKLNFKERVEELARMLGGAEVTDLTRKHAQEMLALAESVRLRKVGRGV
ncbi:MAG TPA: DNA repair protein RecN [Firmicutes bacterium]|nr:DNA repair protein RecN [Bacillota bacterium]HCX70884.1 DNA repair protein RecN [Bacillota bacterium]